MFAKYSLWLSLKSIATSLGEGGVLGENGTGKGMKQYF